jgi:hypothetical protein
MSIQQGKSKVVTLVPEAPMSAPVAVIYDSERRVLVGSGDLTATPSPVSTFACVLEGWTNTKFAFAVDEDEGIEPGLMILVTDPKWGTAEAEVSSVDGSIVRLVEPLPDVPEDAAEAGATVVGLDVTVTVPTTATQTLGVGFVLEVTDGDEAVRTDFAVTAYPFAGPCRARHIREKVARGWAGEYTRDERFHARAAAAVNDEIESRIMATGRYLDRFWSPKALNPLLDAMIPLVLSLRYGLREGGSTREEYNDAAERVVAARVTDLVRSIQLYNTTGDGKITDTDKGVAKRWSMELIQ